MIGETPGPGLAVMMLAVAAAAVVQQVSRTKPVLAVFIMHSPVAAPAVQLLLSVSRPRMLCAPMICTAYDRSHSYYDVKICCYRSLF